jgi:hypothetical protein
VRAKRLFADGLDDAALQIEIAESVLVSDEPRLQQVLAELAALGLGLVVDDFGSGVSSLRALRRVRPASIKIDGALARELPEGQDAAALVSAVVALGRTLGVHVVAEGVETEAQSRQLLALGCDDLQGFYYGHALPDGEWIGYLRWACTAVVGTDGRTRPCPSCRRAPPPWRRDPFSRERGSAGDSRRSARVESRARGVRPLQELSRRRRCGPVHADPASHDVPPGRCRPHHRRAGRGAASLGP